MSDDIQEEESPPPKPRSKKLFIIVTLVVLLLLGGGGGAAWWFKGRGHAAPNPAEEAKKAAAKKLAERAFVTLEPFVVNLADRDADRYAQIGVTLEVADKHISEKVSSQMPAVRNAILLLLSSKLAEQLITREGKEQLASEIAIAAAGPLGWKPPPSKSRTKPASDASQSHEQAPPADTAANPEKQDAETGPTTNAEASVDATQGDTAVPPEVHSPPKAENPVAQVHFASFIVQ